MSAARQSSAASVAHSTAWMARDLCMVLRSNGESFGQPLLDALANVAGLAEEHAERAMKAAWTATGLDTTV